MLFHSVQYFGEALTIFCTQWSHHTRERIFAFGSRAGGGQNRSQYQQGVGNACKVRIYDLKIAGSSRTGPAGLGGFEEWSWEDPDYTNRSNKSNEFGNLP